MRKNFVNGLMFGAGILLVVVVGIAVAVAADILTVDKDGTIRLRVSDTGKVTLNTSETAQGDMRFTPRTADPTAPLTGDIWFNSSLGKMRSYDGANVRDMGTEDWDGVSSGMSATAQGAPNDTVNVSSGWVFINGKSVYYAGSGGTPIAMPAAGASDKVQVIQINGAGVVNGIDLDGFSHTGYTIISYVNRRANNNVIKNGDDGTNSFIYGINKIFSQITSRLGTQSNPTTTYTTDDAGSPSVEGMGITLYTYGSPLEIQFFTRAWHGTTSGTVYYRLDIDGVRGYTYASHVSSAPIASGTPGLFYVRNCPAGVHTISIAWFVSGGTGSCSAGNQRVLSVIERKK